MLGVAHRQLRTDFGKIRSILRRNDVSPVRACRIVDQEITRVEKSVLFERVVNILRIGGGQSRDAAESFRENGRRRKDVVLSANAAREQVLVIRIRLSDAVCAENAVVLHQIINGRHGRLRHHAGKPAGDINAGCAKVQRARNKRSKPSAVGNAVGENRCRRSDPAARNK